jgi:AcrR family transcriptional regulator
MTKTRRGRRPAGSGTREAILEAARQQFGELGYRHTTLRSIGRLADVDPRLVLHYFGSKKKLFIESVELPTDPERVFSRLFDGDREGVAERAAELMIALMEDPGTQRAMTGVIRAAASEPEQAQLIRELLTDRILTPMATRVGGGHPELRASLMASQVVGLMMARHVVAFAPLVAASREQLVRALAPVFEHYLTGEWVDPE